MSILPHQTSPDTMAVTRPRKDVVGPSSRIDSVPAPTWRVLWRAIQPATGPGSEPASTTLEALLSPEVIELKLRDRHGAILDQRRFDVVSAELQRDDMHLLEWRPSPEQASERAMARILLEAGRPPLVRTTLPESMGLPGGRYDVLESTPIETIPVSDAT
ncbi:MAG: hypothetical protein CMJ34_09855 [Phycisphaerae bacterium]|nr:hypothetical protein [Phycisphaerae bacterium]